MTISQKRLENCKDESAFKHIIRDVMGKELGFHTQFHEDKYEKGVPDMSYGKDWVNGWIEFKFGDHKLEPEQRRFLHHRGRKGGFCFLMRYRGEVITLEDWRTETVYMFTTLASFREYYSKILYTPPTGKEVRSLPELRSLFDCNPRELPRHLKSPDSGELPGRIDPSPVTLVSDQG